MMMMRGVDGGIRDGAESPEPQFGGDKSPGGDICVNMDDFEDSDNEEDQQIQQRS